MATFFDGAIIGYWATNPSNYIYGKLTGDVSRSGNTVTLSNMYLTVWFRYSAYGAGSYTFVVNGTGTTWNMDAGAPSHGLNNTSFSVTAGQTSATISWTGSDGYTGNFNVQFPAGSTPPTGLAVSNLNSTDTSVTGTVSITSWGTGSGTKYRELEVYTYSASGLVEPKKYQTQYGDELSGEITVSNSSGGGTLTIVPNRRYVIGAYASNGSASVGPTRMSTAVTKPSKAINQSITNITETSATINWTAPADGGYHIKTYSYSLDNGVTWVQCGTVSSGGAENKTYTISNLLPGTQYTVKLRVTTSAGTTECDDFPTFTTLGVPAHPFYGSVNGQTKKIQKLYGSVNGQTKLVKHLYGSVNGVTKKIF